MTFSMIEFVYVHGITFNVKCRMYAIRLCMVVSLLHVGLPCAHQQGTTVAESISGFISLVWDTV